ncbi:acyltransferase [Enterococcus phoeniculicola]|jgi:peptidoglycan/LPS O-acetylase OafA/YrhL|uniref:Acyltransferase n=1 Tax=Enterococcus phoeniculicola ATCC BAA-412 TaxID=1158610 RepID=R3WA14_9ENTE|nr:acyltransferase family protein [Enterococcus phoeniculicola]EOL44756.1 acyltransferase [Enterococcus phoeniculicola ATCC BAA-412]EOT75045.1 acyltransferase [Enterococcus phoeniculicola ATCC BAA-412]OJG72932.1 acyltransferase [Enterococcus phoeniculicola]
MEKQKRLHSSRYITGIDGLRSLAVIGVILYHLLPSSMKGGYLGVPVFFTVSGYLITDLLCQEWDQDKRINIGQFYVRRMKRLYPSLVFLLVTASAYITLFQRNLLSNLREIVFSSLVYLNNWWQINNGMSYFDRFANESPFTHIWSLAVEGQNYLIWPILFYLLMKFVKRRDWVFYFIMVLSIASAIWMAVLYTPNADPTRVYYGTDTRFFSIGLGSALALVWPSTRLKKEIPVQAKKLMNYAGIISFLLLALAFLFFDAHYDFMYYGGMFLISLICVVLVAVTAHPGASLNKWLTNPVFTWIGKRSYGIYLYQFPVMIFYEAKISNLGDHVWLHTLIELILILTISELSYRFIEKPLGKFNYGQLITNMKARLKTPFLPKEIAVLVVSGLVFLTAVVGWAIAPETELTADQSKLQQQLAANKKAAEKSKTSGQEAVDPKKLTKKYELTSKQAEQAKNLPLTLFGDSLALGATADLQDVFPNIIVDGEIGRQLYDSPPMLQSLIDKKLLKDNVLMVLGTNGSFTEAQMDSVMTTIGKRNVYWVNTHVPTKRWQNEVNTMLEKAEKKYDNLVVIDWYDYSKDHDEWFYDDRVHPNEEGMDRYVSFVSAKILEAVEK